METQTTRQVKQAGRQSRKQMHSQNISLKEMKPIYTVEQKKKSLSATHKDNSEPKEWREQTHN